MVGAWPMLSIVSIYINQRLAYLCYFGGLFNTSLRAIKSQVMGNKRIVRTVLCQLHDQFVLVPERLLHLSVIWREQINGEEQVKCELLLMGILQSAHVQMVFFLRSLIDRKNAKSFFPHCM
jgi:hypothetical protein